MIDLGNTSRDMNGVAFSATNFGTIMGMCPPYLKRKFTRFGN